MEPKEYRNDTDRSKWPDGEWDDEPDKAQWEDEATGLPCLAVRNRMFGNWCGYVGVPPGHELHGKGYGDIRDFDVHGGLTFAGLCQDAPDESIGVCHVPSPGGPAAIWWLGFDCAHAWDISPGRDWPCPEGSYRSLAYVKRECASLARQIASGVADD